MSHFPLSRAEQGAAYAAPSLEPEPMPGDEEPRELDDSVLARAAALRFPDISKLSGPDKVDALTDHIVATAIARGELEELRLEAQVSLLDVRKKLARMPQTGRDRSRTEEARRAAAPQLADEHDHWKWIVDRCTEQINRLGGTDYDAASRAYTLVSGT